VCADDYCRLFLLFTCGQCIAVIAMLRCELTGEVVTALQCAENVVCVSDCHRCSLLGNDHLRSSWQDIQEYGDDDGDDYDDDDYGDLIHHDMTR
jgi:hypothetical protein